MISYHYMPGIQKNWKKPVEKVLFDFTSSALMFGYIRTYARNTERFEIYKYC